MRFEWTEEGERTRPSTTSISESVQNFDFDTALYRMDDDDYGEELLKRLV